MRHALALALVVAAPALAEAEAPSLLVQGGAGTRGPVVGGTLGVVRGRASGVVRFDRDERTARGELVVGWRMAIAGVRVDTRGAFALAGARLGGQRHSLELGLVGRVAGDQMFVQHARYVPGWFARGQQRWSRFVVGAELGASGLAERSPTGELRPDTRALLTLGVDLWP